MKRLSYQIFLSFLAIIVIFSTLHHVTVAQSTNKFTHNALNININGTKQATEWTLESSVLPAQLGAEDDTRFRFWDANRVDFNLKTSLNNLTAGQYKVKLVAHVDVDLAADGGFKLTTYDSELQPQINTIPLLANGSSWGTPQAYILDNVQVGENGQLDLSWVVKTTGENYGFIRSISLLSSDYIEPLYLTINNNATVWKKLHTSSPQTFEDFSNTTHSGLHFWDRNSYLVHLKASALLLPHTQYSVAFFAHSNKDLEEGSKILIKTNDKSYESLINPRGSYENPTSIIESNLFTTGSDGAIDVELIIQAPADTYGYIGPIEITTSAPATTIDIKPKATLLRTGSTVTLQHNITPDLTYTYETSEHAIAQVNTAGVVTAVNEGEATIMVKAVNKKLELVEQGKMQVYISDTFQALSNYGAVQVEPVEALLNDARPQFIMGADISTIEQLEQTGRKFYNEYGVEQSLMTILKDSGINWVRIRSWVDPYDVNRQPYGAGNVDANVTTKIAKQAVDAGLKVLLDIHYSDFWTDPARQSKPKQWANLDVSQLKSTLYNYTYTLVEQMNDADALPDMIQIGNEINGGFLWPIDGDTSAANGRGIANAAPYLEEGIQAVRDFEADYGKDRIKLVIHRTNVNDGLDKVEQFYDEVNHLDYDIIGLSYYPFWHGSLENLQTIMNKIANKFDKDVAIVETSYAYSLDTPINNGSTGNSFGEQLQSIAGYKATAQGQTNAIRDVIAAVANVPNNQGIGVFYWEPAWLPGTDVPWGTAYAASYQGESISANEGSAWVNQALFNQFGEKLPSLDVFKRVRDNDENYTPPNIVTLDDISLTTNVGASNVLPETVRALYSDDQYRTISVLSWSPTSYDQNTAGEYELTGTVEGGTTFIATVIVRPNNYVVNGGLETNETDVWSISGGTISEEKPYTGRRSIHFWNEQQVVIKQTIKNLPKGKYELSAYTRIGIDGSPIESTSRLYAKTDEQEFSTPLIETGWQNFVLIKVNDIVVTTGQLEIGIIVDNGINNYGDFDDFELILVEKIEDVKPNPPDQSNDLPRDSLPIAIVGFNRSDDNEYTIDVKNDEEVTLNSEVLSKLTHETLTFNYPNINMSLRGQQLKVFKELKIFATSQHDPLISPNNGQLNVVSSFIIKADKDDAMTVAINYDLANPALALYYIDDAGKLKYAGGYWKGKQYMANIESNRTYVFVQNSKTFLDVKTQSEAVQSFTAAGILSGNDEQNLNLKNAATRLEFAKILTTLFRLDDDNENESKTSSFTDVSQSSWANNYVKAVVNSGIMNGVSRHSFGVSSSLTTEQVLVAFARAAQIEPLVSKSSEMMSEWAVGYVNGLVEAEVITEDEAAQFNYSSPLSKEDMIELLYKLYMTLSI